MSVRINPCFGCPLKEGCEQRGTFRKKVSGLGLRSATFNCKRLAAALEPGTRVLITHPIRDYGICQDYVEYVITHVEVPATISSSRGHEFSCIIDRGAIAEAAEDYGDSEMDVDRVRFRKTMRHSKIVKFLDEPKRTFCEQGCLLTPDGSCEIRDGECYCKQFEGVDVVDLIANGGTV